jgi:flavin-dependent dehydrogenase
MSRDYDVVIMGGGPAGSTLAAILARHTTLRVALVEQEFFPREHIGESLISTVIPVLSYSGALPKVLASDCYSGPKPGGIFAWNPGKEDPWCFTFSDRMYQELGVLCFAIHVNRSEFDKILLDHARSLGADVYEGASVVGVRSTGEGTAVDLDDGRQVSGRIFVEASGRTTSITGTRKQFLSDYKNIAIWNHFVGCKSPGDLDGDWNIFRGQRSRIPGLHREEWVPIGNFACEDGWFWFIPVPKMVMGKRELTYSIGLVTDPKILSTTPAKRYTDMTNFVSKMRQIPLLRDLVKDAQPISDKVLTATNYSMISDVICNYDEKWILLGDSAFFVDPLFSTGVGLAITNAASVSFLIGATLNDSVSEGYKRDLWYDYQQRMRTMALTLSICVDQWYHAIARKNPDSIYWKSRRGAVPLVDLREKTFYFVGNGQTTSMAEYDYTGDRERWVEALRHVAPSGPARLARLRHSWKPGSLNEDSLKNPDQGLRASDPFTDTLVMSNEGRELSPTDRISIKEEVGSRPSLLLGQMQALWVAPPEFWMEPLEHGDTLMSVPPYLDCQRFYFEGVPDDVQVPFIDEQERGLALYELLKGQGKTYAELKTLVTSQQRSLLGRLHNAGMLAIG